MTNEEKRETLEELLFALLYALRVDLEDKYVKDAVNSIMEVFKCE